MILQRKYSVSRTRITLITSRLISYLMISKCCIFLPLCRTEVVFNPNKNWGTAEVAAISPRIQPDTLCPTWETRSLCNSETSGPRLIKENHLLCCSNLQRKASAKALFLSVIWHMCSVQSSLFIHSALFQKFSCADVLPLIVSIWAWCKKTWVPEGKVSCSSTLE